MLFSRGGEAYLPEERERAEYMWGWLSGRKLSGRKMVEWGKIYVGIVEWEKDEWEEVEWEKGGIFITSL